jgi:PAS domain-containing protein
MSESTPPPRTPADRWPDDTPERAEANRTLREERFRLLVQGVTDYAIFLLDPDGRVICWNTGAERIFGYAEAEVLDRPFALFFTPEDVAAGKPDEEIRTAAAVGSARDDRWHVRRTGPGSSAGAPSRPSAGATTCSGSPRCSTT